MLNKMKSKIKKNKKVGIIVQARTGSTRLPNKIFSGLQAKPMLLHVIERAGKSKLADKIILAIPDTKENDVLEKFARENRIEFFRGSEEDVLSRFYNAAKNFGLGTIARITSDCPLVDPEIVDKVIKNHLDSGADFTSNCIIRTYPRGFDVEVFSFAALEQAFGKAKKKHEREHVVPYIWQNPEVFELKNIEAKGKARRPDLRLTVDTKEDLRVIEKIYENLYRPGEMFYISEIIDFLDKNKQLLQINAKIKQKKIDG